MDKLEKYNSPRITSEILECSMPLTFDQYSICFFNCCYCFSQYIRGTGPAKKNYDKKKIKAVDVEEIKKIFTFKKKAPYSDYIRKKIPMQWGGLSDPFCPVEERYGVGLELMKFFNEIKYPLSFSSKGDLILRDKRYLNEFKKAGDLWHYKASIITMDEEKARIVEKGVPSPKRRFEVLKKLNEVGTKTTLRMRPFIIGLTDKTLEDLIRNAKEVGCESVTTEFFCLDWRAVSRKETRQNYIDLSKAVGFDIVKFYLKFKGKYQGYVRLDYRIKKVWAKKFVDLCHKYGVKPVFSDVSFKGWTEGTSSCCGILDSWDKLNNYAKMQYVKLVNIAKEKGFVTFDDAMEVGKNEKRFRQECKLENFMNLGNNRKRGKMKRMSYWDYFLKGWDDLKWSNNIQNFLDGQIKAKGKDKNGHYVYFYNKKRK